MKVTANARERLESYLHGEGGDLVPAILWALASERSRDGEWIVGFYERSKIVGDWLVRIDEIEFYVDPVDLPKLAGKTLDFNAGRFEFA